MTDKSIMPFGIHKGKQLDQVPDSYLLYLYDNCKCGPELKAYIEDNLDVIKKKQ